jgi:hypothetical protein
MATYLPGVTDYIPQIQPFKPDFNFYANVLQTKEAQYKAGYQRLSGIYGSLLNSEMLRQDNNMRREQFFYDIENNVKKIAGLDLSKNQNVVAAQKIFEPLIDDDYIQMDMAFTKRYRNELSKAEGYKNCTDPKKCGGAKWWNGGVQALHYQAEDFTKAPIQETLSTRMPSYTPYVDVYAKAMEFAKEMNLDTKQYVFDGNFRYLEKNGPKMIPGLTDMFTNYISSDPLALEMYRTQAYLDRKNTIAETAEQFGSEEGAEANYLDTKIAEINETQRKIKEEAEKNNDRLRMRGAVAEKSIAETPIDEDLDAAYLEMLNSGEFESEQINGIKNFATETLSQTENIEALDLESKRRRVDFARANQLLYGDMQNAATDYAMNTYEQSDLKYDEIYLENYKHKLRLAEIDYQETKKKKEDEEDTEDLLSQEGIAMQDPTKGGTAKIDALDLSNKAVSSNNQAYTQSVKETADYFATYLQGVINNPASTEAQKKLAKDQLKIFGTATKVPAPAKQEVENSGGWESWVSTAVSMFSPAAGNVVRAYLGGGDDETTYTVNGLMTEGGKLVDFNNNLTITDPNNPYNRENLYKQLKSYYSTYAEGLARNNESFFTDMGQLLSKVERTKGASDAGTSKLRRDNLAIAPVLGQEVRGGDLYINEDGSLASRDEFRNKFINRYRPGAIEREEGIGYEAAGLTGIAGMTGTGAAMGSMFGPIGTVIGGAGGLAVGLGTAAMSGFMKEDIDDLYEDSVEKFKEIYNGDKVKDLGVGFRTIDGGVSGIGAGNTLFTFDPAIKSGLKTNMLDLARKDILPSSVDQAPKGAQFVFGSITDFTEGDIPDHNDLAKDVVVNLLNHTLGSKWKSSNDKRPITNVIRTGIVGSDPNKVGVTFSLDEDFISMYAGSAKVPGLTGALAGDKPKTVSVVFDRDKVESQFFKDIVQTELEFLYNTNGSLPINAFENVSGSATIVRSANGTPVLNASLKYVDEKTGRLQSVDMDPIVYNKTADINTIYEEYYNLFYQQAAMNYKLKRNASKNTQ